MMIKDPNCGLLVDSAHEVRRRSIVEKGAHEMGEAGGCGKVLFCDRACTGC